MWIVALELAPVGRGAEQASKDGVHALAGREGVIDDRLPPDERAHVALAQGLQVVGSKQHAGDDGTCVCGPVEGNPMRRVVLIHSCILATGTPGPATGVGPTVSRRIVATDLAPPARA